MDTPYNHLNTSDCCGDQLQSLSWFTSVFFSMVSSISHPGQLSLPFLNSPSPQCNIQYSISHCITYFIHRLLLTVNFFAICFSSCVLFEWFLMINVALKFKITHTYQNQHERQRAPFNNPSSTSRLYRMPRNENTMHKQLSVIPQVAFL